MKRFYFPAAIIGAILSVAASVGLTTRAPAAEGRIEPAALAAYVNDDTFFAGFVDVTAITKPDGAGRPRLFSELPNADGEASAMASMLQGLDQMARAVGSAGVDSVYVVMGLADLHQRGGPVLVVNLRAGVAPDNAATMLKSALQKFGPGNGAIEARPHGPNAVLVGQWLTLERYATFNNNERADVVGPLGRLADDGAIFAAVFCPGPDFRRVVRELWPEMPGPLAPLRGELADRWRHLEVSLPAAPNAVPHIVLQAQDAEAAEVFGKLWHDLPTAVAALDGHNDAHRRANASLQILVDALPAKVEGTRASLVFPTEGDELSKLRKLVAQAADASMQSTYMERRLKQFKNIALAMLNYESANKSLPPSAIRDSDGRPLLSWRVAILPYLEQGELYKQFHLDEPWDSPHNLKLLEKMPSVYADPDPELRARIGGGKTTYLVPVAAETIFYKNEGTTIREVSDGTVKTLLVVEVEPSHAVEWTKPSDWEVNLQEPLVGVQRSDRRRFVVAFADSHVETVPIDVEPAKLRGLLTRSGREVFDWP